jgi:hypothetical protein
MLIAIIVVKNIEAEQVDVNNAFTKSKLEKTIYIKLPLDIKIQPKSTLQLI